MSQKNPTPDNTAARTGPFMVVINAASGHNDSAHAQEVMAAVFAAAGRQVRFFEVSDPRRIDEAAAGAVAAARQAGGVVVAAGGDGTINAVAQAVLGSGCPFGVLPQGTFNYFGRAHAIPQGTEAAAHALVGASVSPVQAGLLNGRLFLVNASLGMYPQLLQDREAWKKRLGRSRVVAFVSGLVTVLRSGHRLDLQIEYAGQSTALRTPTLFIGNNPLQLARVGLDDAVVEAVDSGRLAGVALRQTGTWPMLRMLVLGLLGKLGGDDAVESFVFRRLTVNVRRARRMKVALDGEVMWMRTPLVFEVASTPLALMVPAPADRAEVA